jgi:hypothetical protein
MRDFRPQPMHPRAAGPQSFACETPEAAHWPEFRMRNSSHSQARRRVGPLESFACETAGPARSPVIGAVLSHPKRRAP